MGEGDGMLNYEAGHTKVEAVDTILKQADIGLSKGNCRWDCSGLKSMKKTG